MDDEVTKLEAEARLAEYQLHKLVIEMNSMKIEFAADNLKWLDELEQKFPEARDSLAPLSRKLIEQIEKLEKEIEDHFDDLLEVSDLCA